MTSYLLIIIYSTFISIGLPMSIIGVVWPAMQKEFNVPYSYAGFISMTMTIGTIIMSIVSIKLIKRFGTGRTILLSVFAMGLSMLGYYFSNSYYMILLFTFPLGLGMGTIDCGINAYVAQHYKSHHMNWLHCFWGIGAMLGPIIMAAYMASKGQWKNGFLIISLFQLVLALVLLFTLPLWNKVADLLGSSAYEEAQESDLNNKSPSLFSILKVKGVIFALFASLFYCGVENTFGLWGSSFLIRSNGIGEAAAAAWVSLFFGSLAAGRFLSGFISMKVGDKGIIRIGETVVLVGALILIIPTAAGSITGIILLGMGCAPLFPSLIHQTPLLFGKQNAQATVSLQVGMAYAGSTFIPPIFGFAATGISMHIFPYFILVCATALIISSERLNATVHKRERLADDLKLS